MQNTILAHGKNWELPIPSDPAALTLSIESQMTAFAAGLLYIHGAASHIIFSGGHTAGMNYPSEAAAMRDEMYCHFSVLEIPFEATSVDEESHDTITNLRVVKSYLPGLGLDNVILLTIGYHLPRVKKLARLESMPVYGAVASDRVISVHTFGQKHMYRKQVLLQVRQRRSPKPLMRTASAYLLEMIGWTLLVVDPQSRHIARLATRALRHQE